MAIPTMFIPKKETLFFGSRRVSPKNFRIKHSGVIVIQMFNAIRIIRAHTKGILFRIGCLNGGPF